MRTTRTMLVLFAFALAACDAAFQPVGPPPAGDGMTCGGGPGFSADVLDGPGVAENGADPAAVALRTHLASDHIDIDWLPDEGWIEAARGDAEVLYLAPDSAAAGSWVFATVGRDGETWKVDGWGGCSLQPDVGPGMGIASFRVEPDVLDPAATEIPVLVTERACNSGEDARGRITVATLEADDDRVVVTFAVRPRGGAQACPGNPETPFVLELPSPLGDRALLDGSSVPPRDATVCPDIAACP